MSGIKSENECDLEKDVHAEQKWVAGDEKQADSLSSREATQTAEGEPATKEEIENLFHVVDDIPTGVWLASFVASAERFTWYGATGPLRISSHETLDLRPRTDALQRTTFSMIVTARSLAHSAWSKLLRLLS